MSPGTQQPHGKVAETSSRGYWVTLASKGARRFLTDAPGVIKVDLREVGRVLEDGDVTWHTAAARKVRGNVVKGVLVTLARKGARGFLTADLIAVVNVKLH